MTEVSIHQQNEEKRSRNIKVFVRVRPFNEKEMGDKCCISILDEKNIRIGENNAKQNHNFAFDGIFENQTSQQEVYEKVGSEVVNEAFKGINGTIFCYGQASSGKTHTCIGPSYRDENLAGMLPRLIKDIFERIEHSPKNIQIKMKISMIEIYNEKIKDLLNPSKTNLKIRSSKKQGIFLQNVTQKYILAVEQAFSYMNIGTHNRTVTATNMNSQSSRSHMVFIINLHITDIYTGQAKTAKIILVDLAGSQKISKTGAQGKVLEQAKKINTSLTTLGKVINSLSDGKIQHVPYRDSKLTRLLQQSLGGNSITNLIINISPSVSNQPETLSSIRFGQRAKTIKNDPVVNKSFTIEQLLQLLKKAEETIQKQNNIIKQLQNKKRMGGYGATLPMPKMITMHFIDIDNDEQSEESVDPNESDERENDSFIGSDLQVGHKHSIHSVKSERILPHKPKNKNKFCFTGTNDKFFYFQQQQTNQNFDNHCQTQTDFFQQVRNSRIGNQLKNNKQDDIQIESIALKDNCNMTNLMMKDWELGYENYEKVGKNIHISIQTIQTGNKNHPPQIISQSHKQNISNPSDNLMKAPEPLKTYQLTEDQNSAEQNLEKIRQNIYLLNHRYVQEKREKSIILSTTEKNNHKIEQMENSIPDHLR